jgi:hypothetical protein
MLKNIAAGLISLVVSVSSPAQIVPGLTSVKTYVDPSLEAAIKSNTSPFSCDNELTYIPLPAFSVPNYSFIKIDADGKPKRITQDWPAGTVNINKLLPNIATEVAVTTTEGAIGATGIFGASMHGELITIDFMKYRSEPVTSEDGSAVIYSRVGAGMRLKIKIVTSETNLGGSLLAVAASAKAGKTSGIISTDIIGLDANDVTISMPFTSDLSDGSVQKIIEALAVVKSKLNDPATTLVPQFIAKIKCAPPKTDGAKKRA